MANVGQQKSGLGAVMRDIRMTLGDLFSGGKVDKDQELIIEVLFGLLGQLARADSIVTSHEAEFVNDLMDELQLSNPARQVAMEWFERGRQKKIDMATELTRFLAVHPKGSAETGRLFDSLVRLAAADGRVRPREREFLQELTIRLGFEAQTLEARLHAFGPKPG
jgi:DnaJ like chaperone protein